MQPTRSRDIVVRIVFGDIEVGIAAEGVSWSPDVASDMVARAKVLWHDALEELAEIGMLDIGGDEESEYALVGDDEDGDVDGPAG